MALCPICHRHTRTHVGWLVWRAHRRDEVKRLVGVNGWVSEVIVQSFRIAVGTMRLYILKWSSSLDAISFSVRMVRANILLVAPSPFAPCRCVCSHTHGHVVCTLRCRLQWWRWWSTIYCLWMRHHACGTHTQFLPIHILLPYISVEAVPWNGTHAWNKTLEMTYIV